MGKYFSVAEFYEAQPWPTRRAFLAVRELFMGAGLGIIEQLKFNGPFFNYKGYIAYLGIDKKRGPYLSMMDAHQLHDEHGVIEERLKMVGKIFLITEEKVYEKAEAIDSLIRQAVLLHEAKPAWGKGSMKD